MAIIRNKLQNTASAVNDNHHIFDPLQTTSGVVQRNIISSIFNGIFLQDLLQTLDHSKKCTDIYECHILCSSYCGYIILTARSSIHLW